MMKKIGILVIILGVLITTMNITMQAKENVSMNLLVQIPNASQFYLVEMKDQQVKVKTIEGNLYTKINALHGEKATLSSIDFKDSYNILCDTLEDRLHVKIDHYVSIDMNAIIQALSLPSDSYDYTTLSSLISCAKMIKSHFKMSLITHYRDYVNTDLSVNDLYTLYRFFLYDKPKVNYYELRYFTINEKLVVLDTQFHPAKKQS